MATTTKIEWTDATWNPVTGCTPCSLGCDHCYAAAMAARFPKIHDNGADPLDTGDFPLPFSRLQFHPERLEQPLHWRRPRRVFVCSMGDLFHEDAPDEWICAVLDVIRACHARGYGHTFQILTKRPERMRDICRRLVFDPRGYGRVCLDDVGFSLFPLRGSGGLRNVWLGVTVCNQNEADAKIPVLLDTPAVLRFVSIEPMLGPVDLRQEWFCGFEACRDHSKAPCDHPDCESRRLRWVICGGETGPGARALNADWVRSVRDQCVTAGVPFFFKGRGTATTPKSCCTYRRLDGREWSEIPAVMEG